MGLFNFWKKQPDVSEQRSPGFFSRMLSHTQTKSDTSSDQSIIAALTGLFIDEKHTKRGEKASRAYTEHLLSLAVANPYAWRSAQMIATSAAQGRIIFREGGPKGPYIREHPWLERLAVPDPLDDYSTYDILEATFSWLVLTGNAYWILDSSAGFTPPPIVVVAPTSIEVVPDIKTRVREYVQVYKDGRGKEHSIVWPREEVLHIRSFNPYDKKIGMPIQVPLRDTLEIEQSAYDWNAKFFKQGGSFPGVLESDKPFIPQDADQIRRQFAERHFVGGIRAFIPPLLWGGVKWRSTGTAAKDMEFMEGRRYNRETIAGAFGVPAAFLGDVGTITFSALEKLSEFFWKGTIATIQQKVAEAVKRRIQFESGGKEWNIWVGFDNSDVPALQENPKQRAAWAVSYTRFGIITLNEARELALDLPPMEGGDVLLPVLLQELKNKGAAGSDEEDAESSEKAWRGGDTPLADEILSQFGLLSEVAGR